MTPERRTRHADSATAAGILLAVAILTSATALVMGLAHLGAAKEGSLLERWLSGTEERRVLPQRARD